MITIDVERCTGCGACVQVCPHGALYLVERVATLDVALCRDCEACLAACPTEAIRLTTPAQEPAAGPVRVPVRQPERQVIQVRTASPPVTLRARVLPVVGAGLAWAGREILPRLADLLLEGLDRREARQDTPATGKGSGQSGTDGRRRQRRRRRGGGRSR